MTPDRIFGPELGPHPAQPGARPASAHITCGSRDLRVLGLSSPAARSQSHATIADRLGTTEGRFASRSTGFVAATGASARKSPGRIDPAEIDDGGPRILRHRELTYRGIFFRLSSNISRQFTNPLGMGPSAEQCGSRPIPGSRV